MSKSLSRNPVLARLAASIRQDLTTLTTSREQWIDTMVKVATQVAEARGLMPDNDTFGTWWDEQNFTMGNRRLTHNDRAALIELGKNPIAMREAMEASESWSIRGIHQHYRLAIQDHLTSAGKTNPAKRHKNNRGRPPGPRHKDHLIEELKAIIKMLRSDLKSACRQIEALGATPNFNTSTLFDDLDDDISDVGVEHDTK